jgi:hypothetical protein
LRAAVRGAYSHAVDPELRDALDGLRADIIAIRRDMATKADLGALDARIDAMAADMRHQFEVTAEGLRHQMQVMAEGIVMNAEALSRFHPEFTAEIHELRRGR